MKSGKWILSILTFLTLMLPAIATTTVSAPQNEDIKCCIIIDYIKKDKHVQPDPIENLTTSGCWAISSIWPKPPIKYYIRPINLKGLTWTYVVNTLKTAAETWDAATSVELFDNNPTTLLIARVGILDGMNIIGFGILPSNVLALTYLWYTTSGIVEWDMKFNILLVWGDAATNPYIFDFQGVACHEFGHTFGMADIYTDTCSYVTMYGYTAPGQTFQRTLAAPDIEGLHYLYGS